MIGLNVNDMTCGHCVAAVTRAAKSVDWSAAVQVDLQSGRQRVDGGRRVDHQGAQGRGLSHLAGAGRGEPNAEQRVLLRALGMIHLKNQALWADDRSSAWKS